jgi:hypothetical protein
MSETSRSSLVGLTGRITFLRTLEIDPKFQARISSGRWDQMIREANATPAWLANDFNASRRHALIVAQVIKLGQKLTDDAVTMFIKLVGRLLSQANNRKKQRHMDCRRDTAKALRMFLDTITALQSANDYGRNALEVLDQQVGWHRLLRMNPELESMVEDNEASLLGVTGEQYATVNKYAGAFLEAFKFQSARRHDPLLAAISLLKRLYAEKRRILPDRVPVSLQSCSPGGWSRRMPRTEPSLGQTFVATTLLYMAWVLDFSRRAAVSPSSTRSHHESAKDWWLFLKPFAGAETL